jgi:hypothetical protein
MSDRIYMTNEDRELAAKELCEMRGMNPDVAWPMVIMEIDQHIRRAEVDIAVTAALAKNKKLWKFE